MEQTKKFTDNTASHEKSLPKTPCAGLACQNAQVREKKRSHNPLIVYFKAERCSIFKRTEVLITISSWSAASKKVKTNYQTRHTINTITES